MLSSILEPAWLELETDQNVYRIMLVWHNRWHTDVDLEVFYTCVRNYLLSWVNNSDDQRQKKTKQWMGLTKRQRADGPDDGSVGWPVVDGIVQPVVQDLIERRCAGRRVSEGCEICLVLRLLCSSPPGLVFQSKSVILWRGLRCGEGACPLPSLTWNFTLK